MKYLILFLLCSCIKVEAPIKRIPFTVTTFLTSKVTENTVELDEQVCSKKECEKQASEFPYKFEPDKKKSFFKICFLDMPEMNFSGIRKKCSKNEG